MATQGDTTTARNQEASNSYPPPPVRSGGRPLVIASVICSVVALGLLPIILGPIGTVLGFVGYGRGDRKGLWAGIFGIVATVAGLLLAAAVLHARRHSG